MPSTRRLSGMHARTAACPGNFLPISAIALACVAPRALQVRIVRTVVLSFAFGALQAAAQITDIRPGSPLPDATLSQFYSISFKPVKPYQGLPVAWSITPGCL